MRETARSAELRATERETSRLPGVLWPRRRGAIGSASGGRSSAAERLPAILVASAPEVRLPPPPGAAPDSPPTDSEHAECFHAGGRKRHFSWQLHSASPQNVACENNMVTFGSFDRPGRLAEPMQLKFVMGEYAVGLLVHAVFGRISEWMGAGTHKTSTLGQILHFLLSQFKI